MKRTTEERTVHKIGEPPGTEKPLEMCLFAVVLILEEQTEFKGFTCHNVIILH